LIVFLIDPFNIDNEQYPTVVVEVGVSQRLHSLHDRAADYLSPHTSIRIYIALKFYPMRQDGTMVMIALMYRRLPQPQPQPQPNVRPQPILKISFGTAQPHPNVQAELQQLGGVQPRGLGYGDDPLTQPGMPLYQLIVPKADLFHGVPYDDMPRRCALSEWFFPKVSDWVIDLWDIQEVALRNA
jgi:hypothetical protein